MRRKWLYKSEVVSVHFVHTESVGSSANTPKIPGRHVPSLLPFGDPRRATNATSDKTKTMPTTSDRFSSLTWISLARMQQLTKIDDEDTSDSSDAHQRYAPPSLYGTYEHFPPDSEDEGSPNLQQILQDAADFQRSREAERQQQVPQDLPLASSTNTATSTTTTVFDDSTDKGLNAALCGGSYLLRLKRLDGEQILASEATVASWSPVAKSRRLRVLTSDTF